MRSFWNRECPAISYRRRWRVPGAHNWSTGTRGFQHRFRCVKLTQRLCNQFSRRSQPHNLRNSFSPFNALWSNFTIWYGVTVCGSSSLACFLGTVIVLEVATVAATACVATTKEHEKEVPLVLGFFWLYFGYRSDMQHLPEIVIHFNSTHFTTS